MDSCDVVAAWKEFSHPPPVWTPVSACLPTQTPDIISVRVGRGRDGTEFREQFDAILATVPSYAFAKMVPFPSDYRDRKSVV